MQAAPTSPAVGSSASSQSGVHSAGNAQVQLQQQQVLQQQQQQMLLAQHQLQLQQPFPMPGSAGGAYPVPGQETPVPAGTTSQPIPERASGKATKSSYNES